MVPFTYDKILVYMGGKPNINKLRSSILNLFFYICPSFLRQNYYLRFQKIITTSVNSSFQQIAFFLCTFPSGFQQLLLYFFPYFYILTHYNSQTQKHFPLSISPSFSFTSKSAKSLSFLLKAIIFTFLYIFISPYIARLCFIRFICFIFFSYSFISL